MWKVDGSWTPAERIWTIFPPSFVAGALYSGFATDPADAQRLLHAVLAHHHVPRTYGCHDRAPRL